jgi:hypothetical protein
LYIKAARVSSISQLGFIFGHGGMFHFSSRKERHFVDELMRKSHCNLAGSQILFVSSLLFQNPRKDVRLQPEHCEQQTLGTASEGKHTGWFSTCNLTLALMRLSVAEGCDAAADPSQAKLDGIAVQKASHPGNLACKHFEFEYYTRTQSTHPRPRSGVSCLRTSWRL